MWGPEKVRPRGSQEPAELFIERVVRKKVASEPHEEPFW
jgi:hypothetical protein